MPHASHSRGRARIGRFAAFGVLGVLLTTALVFVGITITVARVVITPPRRREQDLRILGVTASTVTLSASQDSLTPGEYSLWFDDDRGHARIGEILSFTDTQVTRRLLAVDFGDLFRARRGRMSGWFYLRPQELGYPFDEVEIATENGPAPAWVIPAAEPSTSWVIQVHGRAVRRTEALRAVPVFREAGYTSLLVSYRNDGEAPESEDGRYALGDTEWWDVEAAIDWALAHGAQNVVLMGWSMGGAIVLQTASRTAHPEVLRGIVLDSPVIDWNVTLQYQAAEMHLPKVMRDGALALISGRWGSVFTGQKNPIDLDRLNFVRRAKELSLPILLLHSDDDGFVPSTASRALAVARPDIVTYEAFATARHTKLWNYDRERWNAAIAGWLRGIR